MPLVSLTLLGWCTTAVKMFEATNLLFSDIQISTIMEKAVKKLTENDKLSTMALKYAIEFIRHLYPCYRILDGSNNL